MGQCSRITDMLHCTHVYFLCRQIKSTVIDAAASDQLISRKDGALLIQDRNVTSDRSESNHMLLSVFLLSFSRLSY